MQSYRVSHRYAAKDGHLFDDKSFSERSGQTARALMQQALENDGPAMATAAFRRWLKTLPRPARLTNHA